MQDFPEFQGRVREVESSFNPATADIRPELLEEVHAIDDAAQLLGEGLKNSCVILGKRIRIPAADI